MTREQITWLLASVELARSKTFMRWGFERACMSEESPASGPPRVVGVDSTDAEEVLGALKSDTARTVLSALHDESGTPSAVADRTGLSLQTVQYHLENLVDADLVEVAGTDTSSKGREMNVYAPASQPVVVFAGRDSGDDVRSLLSRLLSGVGLLALMSLLVQELLGDGVGALFAEPIVRPGPMVAAEPAGTVVGLQPGLAFFAGGFAVLLGAAAYWYLGRHREEIRAKLPV